MTKIFTLWAAALFVTAEASPVLADGPPEAAGAGAAETLAALPKEAVCPVCHVMEGTNEPERIKARRTYEGRTYGFCSDKCAKAFDGDPIAFLPPVFPRPAPAFELVDRTGAVITNDSLRGRVVLIDFWATWCVPCRKSMPELQALHGKFADREFSLIGVSIDEDPRKVEKFVTSKHIGYPIAVDSAKDPAWNAFLVKAVPASFLIDRDGRIMAQWLGAPPDMEALEAEITGLLAPE